MRAEGRRALWGKWLAVGLAVASAGVWLVEGLLEPLSTVAGGLTLTRVARDLPGLLIQVAVPAVGVWLATRRDGPRVSLGLAVIAAWGAVYHLAPQLALLMANIPGVHVGGAPGPLTYVLGTGACVAALVALRCHTEPGWMPAASRTVVAAATVVWAVAAVAAPIAKHALSSQQAGGPWLSAGEVTWLLVLLVIAAVVWRSDSLTAVGAAAVVSLGALVDVLNSALAAFRPEPPPVEALSAGVDGATMIALLVQAVAAAVLTVATTQLASRWTATS